MVIHCTEAFNNRDYEEYFVWFPYQLSDLQKWAIYAIVNGHHSLITAHTGSGKTLPAEFAIQYFKNQNNTDFFRNTIMIILVIIEIIPNIQRNVSD